jgi:hypothetical protein
MGRRAGVAQGYCISRRVKTLLTLFAGDCQCSAALIPQKLPKPDLGSALRQ